MMKIFAIGDLHGHHKEFVMLLDQLEENADFSLDHPEDHLVLLGDLVDTGPDTKDLLDACIAMQKQWPHNFHPLMGNHDHMLLDALVYDNKFYGDYYLWFNQGGRQTVSSYLPKNIGDKYQRAIMQPLDYIPPAHLEFLATLPAFWQTEKYFFVHAGVLPEIPLSEQTQFPLPLEKHNSFLWIREYFYNSKYDWGKKIIFGHTPFEDHTNMDPKKNKWLIEQQDNKIGINTMPRNDGYLTCVQLPEEVFFTQEKL